MSEFQLKMPKMGESIDEATVSVWLKKVGENVNAEESVLEVATDKIDSEIPSPVSGKLSKIFFQKKDTVRVGDVIAIIETDEPQSQEEENSKSSELSHAPSELLELSEDVILKEAQAIKDPIAPDLTEYRSISPLVRSMCAAENISTDEIQGIIGSGKNGRITKDDVLDYIKKRGQKIVEEKETSYSTNDQPKVISAQEISFNTSLARENEEIVEMSNTRKIISEHMIRSINTSAHVTSFVEADVTNIVMWRDRVKEDFQKKKKEKITFTPIFIEAIAKTIEDFPMINISIEGDFIIKKKYINIGIATALDNGDLIVPVIKDANKYNLLGLIEQVNDLASRARSGNLNPAETQNGTFTFTNIGTFGNIMGTPIINQPQAAILAAGVISKKVSVIESPQGDSIGIRHKVFLSHSYDHRVIDGYMGGLFVKKLRKF
uniref:Dihydrolipoamide acetyltransferase component of pyruvate dehydrogenase complex n=1 Tax=Ichthyobacterium seriolicida TaxID=242600 RepID=A0A169Q456_9FLAO|nr:diapophytoene dehydrogenase [Ichthyobacterium seriolicida]